MTGFAASWLALREPADAAARDAAGGASTGGPGSSHAGSRDAASRDAATCDAALVGQLRAAIAARDSALLHVVDLGAGTGANLRYLAPRLGGRQRWTLVDADVALLAHTEAATAAFARRAGGRVTAATQAPRSDVEAALGAGPARRGFTLRGDAFDCEVSCIALDLSASLDALALPRHSLVTAAALLDLVSRDWLAALASRCAAAAASVLFALSYDGRIELAPAERGDDLILDLVNLHQRRDKGFGPALGPTAADAAAAMLAGLGYRVTAAASDWHLGPPDGSLQRELVEGWAAAAREARPERASDIERWRARRLEHVAARRSELIVGHTDVAAVAPSGTDGV